MNNRMWLETMTDAQLAEWIFRIEGYPDCQICGFESIRDCKEKSCVKGIEQWLKQEHIEELERVLDGCKNNI